MAQTGNERRMEKRQQETSTMQCPSKNRLVSFYSVTMTDTKWAYGLLIIGALVSIKMLVIEYIAGWLFNYLHISNAFN